MIRLLVSILCVSSLLFLLNNQFPHVFESPDNYLAIIPLVVILIFLILRVFSGEVKLNVVLRNSIAWVFIFLLVIVGYSYRYELQDAYSHILGNLIPSEGQVSHDKSITFRKSMGGQFHVNAEINGQKVNFLLDTGASKITLSRSDARRLGFDLKKLVYNIRMSTANGMNLAAYVRLNEISVGDIVMKNIDAYVNKGGLDGSLLGMNFLNRLSKYEFSRGEVTFYGK